MKVLLDTNIVLDLLLKREPFCNSAKEIFSLIENSTTDGYLCASTITTIHYLASKSFDKAKAEKIIDDLLLMFEITDINKSVLIDAVKNSGVDFEDSVIYTSAKFYDIDIIITRDKKGFKKSSILTLHPQEFLASRRRL